MPQTLSDEEEGCFTNMVSNLPLLFAEGYPISLDNITEDQLEKFIPFMVQCSRGFIQIHTMAQFNKPEWWPSEVEFTKPFKKPKSFSGNWLQQMREIVVLCYSFHNCIFLLRYCTDLATYKPAELRFINNFNSTTSLYERYTNKLLVTIRNENMLYDQELSSRMCLLPKQSRTLPWLDYQNDMVISAGFNIYLCDYCDAELYTHTALVEHERLCPAAGCNVELEESSDDDDVIFCGEIFDEQLPLTSEARAKAEQQKMVSFLSHNFMLRCTVPLESLPNSSSPSKSSVHGTEVENAVVENGTKGKQRRFPRRTRQVITLGKCTQIPLSSPLGQFMLRSTKTVTTSEYLFERHDRIERFCAAPALPLGHSWQGILNVSTQEGLCTQDRRLPKWLYGKNKSSSGSSGVPITYKRPVDDSGEPSNHQYKFPRRQFSNRKRMEDYMFYNKPLLQRCRSLSIQIKRLTPEEVENLSLMPGIERQRREAELVAIQERQRRKELAEYATIVDSINLCSSDEELTDLEEEFIETSVENFENHESKTSFNNHQITLSDIETIELEMDDGESMSSDSPELVSSFYAELPPQLKNGAISIHSPIASRPPRSSITMLGESTFRLNQSLPIGHSSNRGLENSRHSMVAPLYLYANCSQTAVNVPGDTQLMNRSRLTAKKGVEMPLKENQIIGFRPTGNDDSDDGITVVGAGQYAGTASAVHQATVQQRTLLLAAPIANGGHTLIGTIPVSFGNGASLHSRGSASVVQTLTTTTFVNQTVHSRVAVNRTSGPTTAVITGPAAGNVQ